MFLPDARDFQELFVGGGADRGDAPQRREQRTLERGPDAGKIVERGLEATRFAEAFTRAVRKSVRLVPQTREEEERSRVALQWDRIFLIGQIDAIFFLRGRLAFFRRADGTLLREADDGQVVKAEIARGSERDGELTATTVDDEEIGKLPLGLCTFR